MLNKCQTLDEVIFLLKQLNVEYTTKQSGRFVTLTAKNCTVDCYLNGKIINIYA
jgi:hypothetical protein